MCDRSILPGYQLRVGSRVQQATLLKFLRLSYREFFPHQADFSHLTKTVDQYLSKETPLWWVDSVNSPGVAPVACLWLGNAIDQIEGDRYAHIFLLYVMPDYRRQGIGTALMRHAENWARARGDRQIGLQVFQSNQPALNLYHNLDYQTHSFLMVKPL